MNLLLFYDNNILSHVNIHQNKIKVNQKISDYINNELDWEYKSTVRYGTTKILVYDLLPEMVNKIYKTIIKLK